MAQNPSEQGKGPLPIWFFVGLILAVYGLLVLASGFIWPKPATVLASVRPALWWGALMIVAGGVFLTIGLKTHGGAASEDEPADTAAPQGPTEPPVEGKSI